jgi:hypothetical protein
MGYFVIIAVLGRLLAGVRRDMNFFAHLRQRRRAPPCVRAGRARADLGGVGRAEAQTMQAAYQLAVQQGQTWPQTCRNSAGSAATFEGFRITDDPTNKRFIAEGDCYGKSRSPPCARSTRIFPLRTVTRRDAPQARRGNRPSFRGTNCSSRGAFNGILAYKGCRTTICMDGCNYKQKSDSVAVSADGGTTWFMSVTGMLPTGTTCSAASITKPKSNPDRHCEPVGQMTMCARDDGKMCARASNGKTFCWSPGETGTKTSDNVVQKPRSWHHATPPPPLPNGDTLNQTTPPTTSTTKDGNGGTTPLRRRTTAPAAAAMPARATTTKTAPGGQGTARRLAVVAVARSRQW